MDWLLPAIALLYLVVAFGLTRNTPFPYSPDDFSFLAGGLSDLSWHWKRPVASNLIFPIAAGGMVVSYAALSIATVLVAWLAMRMVADVFEVRIGPLAATAAVVLLVTHVSTFEHGKYLGLITNLASHGFGLVCLLLLWHGVRRGRAGLQLLAALAYVLSALSKEDFLLPPLLMLALLWTMATDPGQSHGRWLRMVGFVAIAIGSMAWNLVDRNPFVSGLLSPAAGDAPYAVHLSPASLSAALRTLFLQYAPLPTLLALLSVAVVWVMRPGLRLRLAWFALTVLSLALPYALIPNNMPPFRAFAWVPWMAGIVAVALQLLWTDARDAQGRRNRSRVALAVAAAVAVAIGSWLMHRDDRRALAETYARGEAVNRNLVATIERLRPALVDEDTVALLGVPPAISPWCGNGPLYLRRKRGFEQRWIVLAEAESACYRNPPPPGSQRTKHDLRLRVEPLAWACRHPDVPVVKFDLQGHGVLLTGTERCAPS